jgi:CubicO group peptidase (beta-lactamase class C family)
VLAFPRRSLLALGVSALASCAPAPRPAREPEVDRERARRRVAGAAVAFVRRGEPDVVEGHGDLTRDTPLEVASLSKPVFALAVIEEAARGAVDLDAPITAISPPPYRHARRRAVDAFDDPRLARITPRGLLSHRSGLPNWARDRPLAFEGPDDGAWSYSGEGYVLLQRAFEGRGESLDHLVRRLVFEPLAMRASSFEPGSPRARAQGRDRAGAAVESSLDAPVAATSLVSTAADYARFLRRIVDAPAGDAAVGAMLTRQVDVDPERGIAWGLGVGLGAGGWFFHWGANPGFRSLFVGSRSRGEAALVLTDSEGGMELAAAVVRERFGPLPLLTYPRMYPED